MNERITNRRPQQEPRLPPANGGAREHIIARTTALLGRKGYGGLTISAICKAADISPPTLYWHFGSKEGLLAAVLKDALRRDANTFLSVDTTDLLPHQVFDRYLGALRSMVVNDTPNNWVILSSLSEAKHAAPEIIEIIAEARRRQVEYNAEQLRKWGMCNDRVLVHLWLSYCNYVALLYHDTKSEALVDEAIVSFRRVYIVTLAALGESCSHEGSFQKTLASLDYQPTLLHRSAQIVPIKHGINSKKKPRPAPKGPRSTVTRD